MLPRITDPDVAVDLPEDAPFAEMLHEIFPVRRVQVQGRPRLQRPMDGREDTHELVVVDMLGKIQSKAGVELARMFFLKDTATTEVNTPARHDALLM